MSKLINRNNKQSGGTYVTIKPDDGDEFTKTEDDEIISSGLFAESNSIKCISYDANYTIVFVCELPNGDTNIKIRSEVNPDKVIRKICIKVALVKTETTPTNTSRLVFNYMGDEFEKFCVSKDHVDRESQTQKAVYDKLLENCHTDIILDTIAVQTVTPEIFKRYTDDILSKTQAGSTKETDEDTQLTEQAIKWLIDTARTNNFNLNLFMMEFLEYYTIFSEILQPLEKFQPQPSTIASISRYHSNGHYRNVYKIVEGAAAQVVLIFGITSNWNRDLNSGNILVLSQDDTFDTKVIDFGLNITLKEKSGRTEVLTHFSNYVKFLTADDIYISDKTLLMKFLDSLTGFGSSREMIQKTFMLCYDNIINNTMEDFKLLLNSKTNLQTKRQIVFKVLMFLTFIDGLILKQQLQQDRFQCRELMKYVFNCDIFNSLSQFCMLSSLQYNDAFLVRVFPYRITFIQEINVEQFKRLCNTILDNICEIVIRLLSVTCERKGGGIVISKKISIKRHPSRKSSTIKRRPRRKSSAIKHRRRRTSRK